MISTFVAKQNKKNASSNLLQRETRANNSHFNFHKKIFLRIGSSCYLTACAVSEREIWNCTNHYNISGFSIPPWRCVKIQDVEDEP